jgi:hypothetical protein
MSRPVVLGPLPVLDDVASPQERIDGLRFGGGRARRAGAANGRDVDLHLVRDGGRDLVLEVQDILGRVVEVIGPDVTLVLHANELDGDPQAISATPQAALDRVSHRQVTPDLVNAFCRVFVLHH